MQSLWRPEWGTGSLGIGGTDSYKPRQGCWELNLGIGPLEEQLLLLTIEPSLKLHQKCIYKGWKDDSVAKT